MKQSKLDLRKVVYYRASKFTTYCDIFPWKACHTASVYIRRCTRLGWHFDLSNVSSGCTCNIIIWTSGHVISRQTDYDTLIKQYNSHTLVYFKLTQRKKDWMHEENIDFNLKKGFDIFRWVMESGIIKQRVHVQIATNVQFNRTIVTRVYSDDVCGSSWINHLYYDRVFGAFVAIWHRHPILQD